MAARFLTDPDQMWAMARRFESHAQHIAAEGQRLHALGQSESSTGPEQQPPDEMHWAFRNVVTMLREVRDGLVRRATLYEDEERTSRELLGGLTGRTFGGL